MRHVARRPGASALRQVAAASFGALALGLPVATWSQPAANPPASPAANLPAIILAPAATGTETSADPDVAAAADQVGVRWQLTVSAPKALRELLEKHLDLARYQQSAQSAQNTQGIPGTQDASEERINSQELNRLIASAPAQARALLETEGYFNAEVRVTRTDAGATGPAIGLTLQVTPGPLTRVAGVRLELEGALSVAADTGDAESLRLAQRLRNEWALRAGDIFTQAGWGSAKNSVVGTLRTQGYTAAALSGSTARIDTQRQQATLYLVADSGPLARFGATVFEGLSHVREADLRLLMNYAPGDPLLEQTLLDYQDRLVKTTLFDSVAVTVDTEDATSTAASPPDGVAKVLVRLKERSLHQATVGVGVSESTGPRVTLEHLHQQIFGLAWQAKTRLQLGSSEQTVSLDLLSHPKPGPYRNLIAGSVVRTVASGLVVTSEKLRVGRTQDTERIERLYFLEGLRDSTRPRDGSTPTDSIGSLTANYHWVWRDLDHPLLPTRGTGVSAEAAAGRSFHQAVDSGWFGRATARVTRYWTLGDRWYGQARVQAGQIFAPASTTVPYTLLFRAGGDESVRGYDYQSIGPSNAAGTAVGGRVLGSASVELARPISDKLPSLWMAGFVDAGDAAPRWNDLSPKLGYGVGLRWRSPVGALKLDLAYGEELRKFRLHFTVGMTF